MKERFDRLEQSVHERFGAADKRFDRLEKAITNVRDELTHRIDGMSERIDGMSERIDGLSELPQRVDGVSRRLDELSLRVGVLHEDLVERIAASSERNAISREEFRLAIAELTENFGRRIDPLELTVREHSVDIATLKRMRL